MTITAGPVRRGDGRAPRGGARRPEVPAVRAASCYGPGQVWFTGDRVRLVGERRYRLPREERMRGYQEVELRHSDAPHTVVGRGFDEPGHMAGAVGVH